jgi:hypothetical protein
MPNKWVEYVKQYAKENNMSYACALTDPNVKSGYASKTPPTKKSSSVGKAAAIFKDRDLQHKRNVAYLGLLEIGRKAEEAQKEKAQVEEEKKEIEKRAKVKGKVVKIEYLAEFVFDDEIYWYNPDNDDCYGIVSVDGKDKVMIMGKYGDDGSADLYVDLYDEPKPVPSNYRFYSPDGKPIKELNKLQTKKK